MYLIIQIQSYKIISLMELLLFLNNYKNYINILIFNYENIMDVL